jgi:hypothetical protein
MLFLLLVLLSLVALSSSFVLGLGPSYNRCARPSVTSIHLAEEYTPFGEDAPLDTGDEDESELEFNRRMALEAYDDLRGVDTLVSYDKFMEWDDIKEVGNRGVGTSWRSVALHGTA